TTRTLISAIVPRGTCHKETGEKWGRKRTVSYRQFYSKTPLDASWNLAAQTAGTYSPSTNEHAFPTPREGGSIIAPGMRSRWSPTTKRVVVGALGAVFLLFIWRAGDIVAPF